MRIGEVAERAGVPTKTIRYYETVDLLPAPDRAANGYRDYADGIIEALIDQRAVDIDRRISELQAIRAELARLAERALRLNPADCSPAFICHIITPSGRHGKPAARTPRSG